MTEERIAQTSPDISILSARNIVKHFGGAQKTRLGTKSGGVQAVDGISFDVFPGETVGLVGESGCGKSTLARVLMRLEKPTEGSAYYLGEDIYTADKERLRAYRRGIQMVFQDPFSSLNPRHTIGRSIVRAFENNPGFLPKKEWRPRAAHLLTLVGLGADRVDWFPHQLSGGQRQRVAIARALALEPKVVVCDEPVSALDVSIQAQILVLLEELQSKLGVSYVFISHDLDVVHRVASRVLVMYLGRIVESGPSDEVFLRPAHPYTEALLRAVPIADPRQRGLVSRHLLQGDPPNPANPPSGCRFRTRCPKAQDVCARVDPQLAALGPPSHLAACHFPNVSGSPTFPESSLSV